MRYWLYKCNIIGGPAGWPGDWTNDVFASEVPVEWGGHYSTRSPEVANLLDDLVAVDDVVVAYQTNEKAVVGYCRIDEIRGQLGALELVLQPIHLLTVPFMIHQHKKGTVLEHSNAVRGQPMLRELQQQEMSELVRLSGAPDFVLRGHRPTQRPGAPTHRRMTRSFWC